MATEKTAGTYEFAVVVDLGGNDDAETGQLTDLYNKFMTAVAALEMMEGGARLTVTSVTDETGQ